MKKNNNEFLIYGPWERHPVHGIQSRLIFKPFGNGLRKLVGREYARDYLNNLNR